MQFKPATSKVHFSVSYIFIPGRLAQKKLTQKKSREMEKRSWLLVPVRVPNIVQLAAARFAPDFVHFTKANLNEYSAFFQFCGFTVNLKF